MNWFDGWFDYGMVAQVWHSNKSWRVYFCSFTIIVLEYLLCSNTVVSGHWPLTTVLLHNRYRWLVVTCCDVDILRLHIRNNSRSPGSDNSTGERSLSPMCSRLMSISQRVTASRRHRCEHITAPPSHDSANRRVPSVSNTHRAVTGLGSSVGRNAGLYVYAKHHFCKMSHSQLHTEICD